MTYLGALDLPSVETGSQIIQTLLDKYVKTARVGRGGDYQVT